MKNLLACLLVAAACGGGGGTNTDMMGDDTPGVDAAIDAPVSTMITISGVATVRAAIGGGPEAGVLVQAYRSTDEATAIAMATTDAQGMYTMTITSNGQALDGFLKATKTGLLTTYLTPPFPIGADTTAPINMVSQSTYNTIHNLCGASVPIAGTGVIALVVVNGQTAQSMPVAGATITTAPASEDYCYNSSGGLPQNQAMATAADGIAYALNLAAGAAVVTGTKTGSTFKTTSVKVRAASLNTTLITP